jgi:hypothetical protein
MAANVWLLLENVISISAWKASTTLAQEDTARLRVALQGGRQGHPAIGASDHPALEVLPVGAGDPGQREGSRNRQI